MLYKFYNGYYMFPNLQLHTISNTHTKDQAITHYVLPLLAQITIFIPFSQVPLRYGATYFNIIVVISLLPHPFLCLNVMFYNGCMSHISSYSY